MSGEPQGESHNRSIDRIPAPFFGLLLVTCQCAPIKMQQGSHLVAPFLAPPSRASAVGPTSHEPMLTTYATSHNDEEEKVDQILDAVAPPKKLVQYP